MLKNASNQRGANSVTVVLLLTNSGSSRNYLATGTWILNGSSIECHEKKHQPFSLSCVRFGSRAIQGIASNILRNKAALVMGISTLAFKLFVRENVALYTKQDFLFHIDTTLNVEVLPNLTNLTFGLKPQVVASKLSLFRNDPFSKLSGS